MGEVRIVTVRWEDVAVGDVIRYERTLARRSGPTDWMRVRSTKGMPNGRVYVEFENISGGVGKRAIDLCEKQVLVG